MELNLGTGSLCNSVEEVDRVWGERLSRPCSSRSRYAKTEPRPIEIIVMTEWMGGVIHDSFDFSHYSFLI